MVTTKDPSWKTAAEPKTAGTILPKDWEAFALKAEWLERAVKHLPDEVAWLQNRLGMMSRVMGADPEATANLEQRLIYCQNHLAELLSEVNSIAFASKNYASGH